MFHELLSRDREDGSACPPLRACSLRRGGRATGQPQGVGPEAYLNGTQQGATPEDARLPARREGRPYPRSQQVIHETSGLGRRSSGVEQLIRNQQVAGSNPIAGSNL
jgi:hypothetical protein